MKFDRNRALELLRKGTGLPHADFHENQDRAIQHVVEGDGSLLVVQKTGWGKSNVYFIATKLMREQGAGPALLISPLLSLMRNQISAASRMGVRAETINSSNTEDWEDIIAKVHRDEVDILLISLNVWQIWSFASKFWALLHKTSCSWLWTRRIAYRIGGTIFGRTTGELSALFDCFRPI